MSITLKFTKNELVEHCEKRITALTNELNEFKEQSASINEVLTSISAYYKQLEEKTRDLFERNDILTSISKMIVTSKYYQSGACGPAGPPGPIGTTGPTGHNYIESGEELVDRIKSQAADIANKIKNTSYNIHKFDVIKNHLHDDEYTLTMYEAAEFELLKDC